MSSNPRADSRPGRPWTLRRRLLAQLVGLLAVVCLLIGVVTMFALDAFLVGKLDDQLTGANDRGSVTRALPRPPPGMARPDPLAAPGQPIGTVDARVAEGTVVSARMLTDAQSPQAVTSVDAEPMASLPPDGRPRTVDLGALGSYRATANHGPDGLVRVTGLPLSEVDSTLLSTGLILGGVALAGLVVTGFLGAWTVRRTLRPLDRLAATAEQVTEIRLDRGDVSLPVLDADAVDSRTEVGKVGAALNRMLGHVGSALSARQASETRVRRFVADASHELRTPLASIRGYAELTRRHGGEVPEDIRFAMSRVEAESGRMTTLVEELLLLARLDEGRPLTLGEVDLSRMVADAVADAHVAGPEHHWHLDAPAEPVLLRGDEAQLHQVLVNLLGNARSHTPAGTTVRIGLSGSRHAVRVRVRDDGPGIPSSLLPEVFERFARGDDSRSRTAGSTGLGLAIVAAVVAAHRGTVTVDVTPGRTEFLVTLPRDPDRPR